MREVHIVGNWKMNQSVEEINSFFKELGTLDSINCQAWIAPQAMHLGKLLEQFGFFSSDFARFKRNSEGFTGFVDVLYVDFHSVLRVSRFQLAGENRAN